MKCGLLVATSLNFHTIHLIYPRGCLIESKLNTRCSVHCIPVDILNMWIQKTIKLISKMNWTYFNQSQRTSIARKKLNTEYFNMATLFSQFECIPFYVHKIIILNEVASGFRPFWIRTLHLGSSNKLKL